MPIAGNNRLINKEVWGTASENIGTIPESTEKNKVRTSRIIIKKLCSTLKNKTEKNITKKDHPINSRVDVSLKNLIIGSLPKRFKYS
ncbi:hypothetical protein [Colwellia sp. BRX10-4]|uniref:hypothetical protein n=1 Tax=Colwellia sp. BRX10-4 TaxID=2759843 RepID=UPI0015F3B092|nr:hypothetical protein [Colwellia sp. BRX10-4]MBA6399866.1 hypothetical protein [Colwellia sp. BRX10-4]